MLYMSTNLTDCIEIHILKTVAMNLFICAVHNKQFDAFLIKMYICIQKLLICNY